MLTFCHIAQYIVCVCVCVCVGWGTVSVFQTARIVYVQAIWASAIELPGFR